ncbi:MAG TPA: Ig-like domain-containing protein [Hymenobacter sp.]|uniref:glucuronyl esterase domain-containing protein n=1 Tax=Hymenobacter sp. TaxID=1898978 RepID=UPI002D80B805|nr:Ig-like domain-containing protein [Hymenobacter sp.]HET9504164.1 Ig-like domain-containing protein [Hymenobacter sp.]
MWADGRGRSTSFSDWECRRNEIKAQLENYEIGRRPTRPQHITATYTATSATAGTLTVNVTVNNKTLTLTSQVSLPASAGPFPAIIGMNSPSGSVPATVFTSRNIARITYNHNNVTTYGAPSLNDPYYQLYPDQNLSNSGQYAAWSWGVSRLIDGLELVQGSLPIDLQHIGVTGCSYAGKMALFSGAMDERIALTIAQESGGGGAPAWRVSETLGAVEKLGATDYRWFKDDMQQFAGANVAKLPHDHHELMAMIAPRALLVTGNTDFEWLANPAAYVSARAAHEVWKQFGIGDRFGFYIDGGHNHCAVPAAQQPAMEAFVDKFLLGNTSVNTSITVHPYPTLDYQRWYKWWGTANPVLPAEPLGKRIWLDAECATVGSDWQIVADTAAAHGKYVVVNGLNSTATAPAASGTVVFAFTVDSAATYNIAARLNCPTANDDSYWVKLDNGAFTSVNGLTTSGWQWTRLTSGTLGVGPHTLTIGYREDGAQLDKVLVTTSNAIITGKGPDAENCTALLLLSPAAGPVGTSVTITGTNLSGTTGVSFNGTAASSFVVNSATSLTAVVAAGTTTGPVSVTTPSGSVASATSFVVRVAPTTVADTYTTPQGTLLKGNVLSNDLGTNPRAILIIRPTHGTLLLNPDGTFTYQPNAGFTGQDSFIYYACDPGLPLLCGNAVTVGISVLRVPPTTVPDVYTTRQGGTLTGNVLSNDLGTSPRAILIIRPTHGTLLLNPDGTFTYQPAANYVGADSFLYYACDPGLPLLCGNPATVSISIGPATSAQLTATNKPVAATKPGTSAAAGNARELAFTGSPNPFSEQLRVSFTLPAPQAYTLTVYDGQGRLVQQLASGAAPAGQVQEVVVPTHAYAAGLYLVRLTMGSGTQQLKFIKVP